jgi:hypothetical protein
MPIQRGKPMSDDVTTTRGETVFGTSGEALGALWVASPGSTMAATLRRTPE